MIKALIRTLVVTFILLMTFITLMLTPLGLTISLHLAKHFLPGELTYHESSGIILGPIDLQGITYQNNGETIKIKQLKIQWSLLSLLRKRITVKEFAVSGVSIVQSNTQTTSSTQSKKSLKETLNESLKQLHQLEQQYLSAPSSSSEAAKPSWTFNIKGVKVDSLQYGTEQQPKAYQLQNTTLKLLLTQQRIDLEAKTQIQQPHELLANVSVVGPLNGYKIHATLTGYDTNWSLQGSGDTQQAQAQSTSNTFFGGTLSANLKYQWHPMLTWDANVQATGLYKQFDFTVVTKKTITNNQAKFSLTANADAPKAKLQMQINHAQHWTANWNVNIQDLSTLHANFIGSLISKGSLHNHNNQLTSSGTLSAQSVKTFRFGVNQLTMKWNAQSNLTQQSMLNLSINGLSIDDRTYNNVTLKLNGTQLAHHLHAAITTNQASLITDARGSWQNKEWKGQLNTFNIRSQRYHNWRLNHPFNIAYKKSQLSFTSFCIQSNYQGKLCVTPTLNNSKNSIDIKANNIQLGLLTSFFVPNVSLTGKVDAKLNFATYHNHLTAAQGDITLHPGKLTLINRGNYVSEMYQGGTINFAVKNSTATAAVQLALSSRNTLSLKLKLPNFSDENPLSSSSKLAGTLSVQLGDLSMISKLLPNVSIPSGQLKADFQVNGTLGNPSFSGNANLAGARIISADLGLNLTQVQANIRGDHRKLDYQLSAVSGGKTLTLNGSAEIRNRVFTTNATLSGNDVLLVDNNEYKLYGSPEFKVRVHGKQIHLNGKLDLTRGMIEPVEFNNVETLPQDQVVFIGSPKSTEPNYLIHSDITITINPAVKVKTSGFEGQLQGQLQIIQKPRQVTVARGRISVVKGTYSTHGSTMTIEPNSSVSFSNTPLNNPNLDIRASKTIRVIGSKFQNFGQNNITVGLVIGGSLKNPRVTLFSVPAVLSQADILSYLILGNVTSALTSSGLGTLLDAAQKLNIGSGTGGLGGAVDQLKQGLGLSEFGIESETTANGTGTEFGKQTSFVVGKNISDRIYIRYSHALNQPDTSSPNTIAIQFKLGRGFVLQTSSDTQTDAGADLLYTVEKK